MNQQIKYLPYSMVTPRSIYLSRRRFLAAAIAAAGASKVAVASGLNFVKSPFSTTEKQTPYKAITTYNNYYEFGTDKADPAKNAKTFRTRPWTVAIEGAVEKPLMLDIDAIFKIAPLEERVYRHRCVEAWSIVVPWIGFPLSALVNLAKPRSNAKYVAFQSLYDPKQMPLGKNAGIQLPYVEGLRMDEALHPLAISGGGLIRGRPPESERSALAFSYPMEVRLQEYQIDCQDPVRGKAAANHLESRKRKRVWLLFQRESRGKPSTMESGQGAPIG